MKNRYSDVDDLDLLENEKSRIYTDCCYYNNCSVCPYKNEDTDCDLILITRRIAQLEKKSMEA